MTILALLVIWLLVLFVIPYESDGSAWLAVGITGAATFYLLA